MDKNSGSWNSLQFNNKENGYEHLSKGMDPRLWNLNWSWEKSQRLCVYIHAGYPITMAMGLNLITRGTCAACGVSSPGFACLRSVGGVSLFHPSFTLQTPAMELFQFSLFPLVQLHRPRASPRSWDEWMLAVSHEELIPVTLSAKFRKFTAVKSQGS